MSASPLELPFGEDHCVVCGDLTYRCFHDGTCGSYRCHEEVRAVEQAIFSLGQPTTDPMYGGTSGTWLTSVTQFNCPYCKYAVQLAVTHSPYLLTHDVEHRLREATWKHLEGHPA